MPEENNPEEKKETSIEDVEKEAAKVDKSANVQKIEGIFKPDTNKVNERSQDKIEEFKGNKKVNAERTRENDDTDDNNNDKTIDPKTLKLKTDNDDTKYKNIGEHRGGEQEDNDEEDNFDPRNISPEDLKRLVNTPKKAKIKALIGVLAAQNNKKNIKSLLANLADTDDEEEIEDIKKSLILLGHNPEDSSNSNDNIPSNTQANNEDEEKDKKKDSTPVQEQDKIKSKKNNKEEQKEEDQTSDGTEENNEEGTPEEDNSHEASSKSKVKKEIAKKITKKAAKTISKILLGLFGPYGIAVIVILLFAGILIIGFMIYLSTICPVYPNNGNEISLVCQAFKEDIPNEAIEEIRSQIMGSSLEELLGNASPSFTNETAEEAVSRTTEAFSTIIE